MKRYLNLIGALLLLATLFLSGCQQEGTSTDENFDNIYLDSDIVELVYSKMSLNKNEKGIILDVEVQYRFKNIANRKIDINVFAEFYDKEDTLLAREGPKEITIPKGWTEQGLSPANIINYSGEKSPSVDYVKIVVEERN
jgi:hypothetical protein